MKLLQVRSDSKQYMFYSLFHPLPEPLPVLPLFLDPLRHLVDRPPLSLANLRLPLLCLLRRPPRARPRLGDRPAQLLALELQLGDLKVVRGVAVVAAEVGRGRGLRGRRRRRRRGRLRRRLRARHGGAEAVLAQLGHSSSVSGAVSWSAT